MPPRIIADSDDDEQDYSSPHSPETSRSAEVVPTRSTGTSSTDPIFFQTIYNEQNAAAIGDPGGDGITSSEVTAPAPFRRTVTGILDPSSLTSVTDPTAPREKSSSGRDTNDWTQVSTPGRKKAPTAMMGDDLWDVPSSPETSREALNAKFKRQDMKARPTSKAGANSRKPTIHLRGAAGASVGRNSDESPSGDVKRRKLEQSQASVPDSDGVDLVTVPYSNDSNGQQNFGASLGWPTDSQMLPPTLPVKSGTSFYVELKSRMDGQLLQHDELSLVSSDSTGRATRQPIYNAEGHHHVSSGTSTNVNTPRSDYPSPQAQSSVGRNMDSKATKKLVQRSPFHIPDSSPDIICAMESPMPSKNGRQDKPRQDTSAVEEAGIQVSAVEEVLQWTEPSAKEVTANEGTELCEEPIKPKRTRGRPKKKLANQEMQSASLNTTHHETVEEEPAAKPKRKRGRPRKSEANMVPTADLQAEESGSPPKAAADTNSNQSTIRELDKEAEMQHTRRQSEDGLMPDAQEAENQASPRCTSKDAVEATLPGEGDVDGSQNMDPTAMKKSMNSRETSYHSKLEGADSDEAMVTSTGAVPNKNNKGPAQSRGMHSTPTSVNKPLFRVGLSKRSRIAPLLKSLRK